MSKSASARARYLQILARRKEGELLSELAERFGVEPRTFYRWRARFKACQPEPASTHEADSERGLVPVEVRAGTGQLDLGALLSPGFEVALRQSGHLLRVPSSFDGPALSRLVAVLESR